MTGSGRAAVAVIEVRGPLAADCIARGFHAANKRRLGLDEVRFGSWGPDESDSRESIVVVRVEEEVIEIHCHGGPAAIARIEQNLIEMGVEATSVAPNMLFHRDAAVIEGPLIREACEVLPQCSTKRTAAIALDQARGALRDWREQAQASLTDQPDLFDEVTRQAAAIAERGRYGKRLNDPFRVTVVGPPNVGKSSLINAIAGFERSITMDLPGTTRDVLETETVVDGWPIRFSDTAGFHHDADPLERQGIEYAIRSLETADLLIGVSDPAIPFAFEEARDKPMIRILNKADRLNSSSGREWPALRTVATTGDGVPELLVEIVQSLVGSAPVAGFPVPVNERQVRWLKDVAAAPDVEALRSRLDDNR
ncbi:MAG: GTPase [Planctomycetota bacterium]